MSTSNATSVTVAFDARIASRQADIIGPATEVSAGVMTAAQVALLNGAASTVIGTLPIVVTAGDISIDPATDSTAGSMSAADKTKLDGIPSGGGGGALDFAEFYGRTAGTGAPGGGTDYAGTIAVRTTNGTGNVPFPSAGAAKAGTGITALTTATFQLAAIGVYQVTFRVHTTEPGQLELVLNNALLPETCMANMNPTAGGHPITGTFFVQTTLVDSVLEVVNPNGNSPALTITPADGSSTHANAQVLTIMQIA